jgi:hypothetical protein
MNYVHWLFSAASLPAFIGFQLGVCDDKAFRPLSSVCAGKLILSRLLAYAFDTAIHGDS